MSFSATSHTGLKARDCRTIKHFCHWWTRRSPVKVTAESMATRGRQRPRPSAPYRFFSWHRLPTPGPAPTHSRSSSSNLHHFSLSGDKLQGINLQKGARRGRSVHGRLPVKLGALPGPASKWVEAHERWGPGPRWGPWASPLAPTVAML